MLLPTPRIPGFAFALALFAVAGSIYGATPDAAVSAGNEPTRTFFVRVHWATEPYALVPGAIVGLRHFPRDGKDADPGFDHRPDPFFFDPPADTSVLKTTGPDGVAEFTIPASWKEFHVLIRHDGAAYFKKFEDHGVGGGDFYLHKSAEVFGTVSMGDPPRPAAEARVRLVNFQGAMVQESISDEQGMFRFSNVDGDEYRILAELGNFISATSIYQSTAFKVADGGRVGPLAIALRPGVVLRGVVRTLTNGAPIAGAKVSTLGISGRIGTATDSTGAFRIEGVPVGDARVRVEADGHIPEERELRGLASGERVEFFALPERVRLRVRAIDPQGGPVAGAEIRIGFSLNPNSMRAEATGTTDGDGFADIDGAPRAARFYASARKDGFKNAFEERPAIGPLEIPEVMTLRFSQKSEPAPTESAKVEPARGYFAGTIRNSKGEPISGVKVRWAPQGNTEDSEGTSTLSGPDGAYRLTVKGDFQGRQLSAQGAGMAISIQKDAKPGDELRPARVDFALEEGKDYVVLAVHPAGKPVPEAFVSASLRTDPTLSGERIATQTTGADGRAVFRALPKSNVSFSVERTGYYPQNFARAPGESERKVVMQKATTFRSKVIDAATRKPIETFNVFVNGNPHRGNPPVLAYPGGELNLPTYEPNTSLDLTIDAEGYALYRNAYLVRPTADEEPVYSIELAAEEPFRGRLVSAADSRPVASAQVSYLPPPALELPMGLRDDRDRIPRFQRTATDADGVFTFRESAPKGAIRIAAPGMGSLQIDPAARDVYRLDLQGRRTITVPLESSLSGTLFVNGAPQPGVSIRMTLKRKERSLPVDTMGLITDPGGAFSARGLGPGTYRLDVELHSEEQIRISAPAPATGLGNVEGFPWANSVARMELTKTIEIRAGEAKHEDFTSPAGPYKLSGVVLDSGERPLPNYQIELIVEFDWERRRIATTSDKDGRYEFAGLAPGKYSAYVQQAGTYPYDREFEEKMPIQIAGDMQRDFRPAVYRRISGSVSLGEQANAVKAIEESTLTFAIQQKDFGTSETAAEQWSRTHSPQVKPGIGPFSVAGLFAGLYAPTLAGAAPGGASFVWNLMPRAIDNTANDADLGEIQIPSGALRVRTNDPGAGEIPTRRFDVHLLPADAETSGTIASVVLKLPESALSGEFVFPIVPAGSYRVAVASGVFRAASAEVLVKIGPNRESSLDLPLALQGRLHGYAYLAQIEWETPMRIRSVELAGQGTHRRLEAPAGVHASPPLPPDADALDGTHFEFRNLEEGTYTVTIDVAGHERHISEHYVLPGRLPKDALSIRID